MLNYFVCDLRADLFSFIANVDAALKREQSE